MLPNSCTFHVFLSLSTSLSATSLSADFYRKSGVFYKQRPGGNVGCIRAIEVCRLQLLVFFKLYKSSMEGIIVLFLMVGVRTNPLLKPCNTAPDVTPLPPPPSRTSSLIAPLDITTTSAPWAPPPLLLGHHHHHHNPTRASLHHCNSVDVGTGGKQFGVCYLLFSKDGTGAWASA